jgi:hypothetical protein
MPSIYSELKPESEKEKKKQIRLAYLHFILYFNARYFMLLLEYMEIKFLLIFFANSSMGNLCVRNSLMKIN